MLKEILPQNHKKSDNKILRQKREDPSDSTSTDITEVTEETIDEMEDLDYIFHNISDVIFNNIIIDDDAGGYPVLKYKISSMAGKYL